MGDAGWLAMIPTDSGPTVTLPPELSSCRHGLDLCHLTTHKSLGRWLLWGHYACSECRTVILAHFQDPPTDAVIEGRLLPIHARHDSSSRRTD